jgi:hypothetical protein
VLRHHAPKNMWFLTVQPPDTRDGVITGTKTGCSKMHVVRGSRPCRFLVETLGTSAVACIRRHLPRRLLIVVLVGFSRDESRGTRSHRGSPSIGDGVRASRHESERKKHLTDAIRRSGLPEPKGTGELLERAASPAMGMLPLATKRRQRTVVCQAFLA